MKLKAAFVAAAFWLLGLFLGSMVFTAGKTQVSNLTATTTTTTETVTTTTTPPVRHWSEKPRKHEGSSVEKAWGYVEEPFERAWNYVVDLFRR